MVKFGVPLTLLFCMSFIIMAIVHFEAIASIIAGSVLVGLPCLAIVGVECYNRIGRFHFRDEQPLPQDPVPQMMFNRGPYQE